jgi:hypothetical protein
VAPPAGETAVVKVLIPDGVTPGMQMRFAAPDGRMIQCVVPQGYGPGQTMQVQVPRARRLSQMGYTTLLEAFKDCTQDKSGSGVVTDHHKFAQVAKSLTAVNGDVEMVWQDLDQDGNGAVNFPEFVEWAENHGVELPIGLEGEGGAGISLPHSWTGRHDDKSWNKRIPVTDKALLAELASLFKVTYKAAWTRDRKSTGVNKVPSGYEFVKAEKNENYADWKGYYLKRHMLAHDCTKKPFVQIKPLTGEAKDLVNRHKLRGYCNEWFLLHGTNPDAAENIARGEFGIDLAGTTTGTLYGKGTYFAESVTKADEYAGGAGGSGDAKDAYGLCCMLLCRVVGGYVLYNEEVTPDANALQAKVTSGEYHSILGDREKCRGTYKEYVIFDGDQVYVDYILYYKRVFAPLGK